MACPPPTFTFEVDQSATHGPWGKWAPWLTVPVPKPSANPIALLTYGRFRYRERTWTWAVRMFRTESKNTWVCARAWFKQGDGQCARYNWNAGRLEYNATAGTWICQDSTQYVETRTATWTETQYEWCIDDRLEDQFDLKLESLPFFNGSWISAWVGEPPHENDFISTGCSPRIKWLEPSRWKVTHGTGGPPQPFMSVELKADLPSGTATLPVTVPIGLPAALHSARQLSIPRHVGAVASTTVRAESLTTRHVLAELVVVDQPPGMSAGFTTPPIVHLTDGGHYDTELQVSVYDESLHHLTSRANVIIGLRDPRASKMYSLHAIDVAILEARTESTPATARD